MGYGSILGSLGHSRKGVGGILRDPRYPHCTEYLRNLLFGVELFDRVFEVFETL